MLRVFYLVLYSIHLQLAESRNHHLLCYCLGEITDLLSGKIIMVTIVIDSGLLKIEILFQLLHFCLT